jgi:hypothetical protein
MDLFNIGYMKKENLDCEVRIERVAELVRPQLDIPHVIVLVVGEAAILFIYF